MRRRRSRRRVARGREWLSSNFAGVGYAARYEHPFRAPKWTSSSLEGPFQEIAEDEQGEGGRCMGSCFHKEIWLSLRRQWGANRDPLCLSFPLSLVVSTSLCLSSSPLSLPFFLSCSYISSLSLSLFRPLSRPLFTPLCGPMNPRGIIVTSFVPFDYLGTIQLCAKTSWYA